MFLSAHRRVFAAFAIYSFCLGQLFTRLPAVKETMNVQEGALGLALIGASVGTLIALTLGSPVIERFGHKRTLIASLTLMPVLYAIAILAPGPGALFLLLIPAGLTLGLTEVIINVEADRTEAQVGRRIMNRAHAFWSFGFFGAGLFGAAMAQMDVPPAIHMLLVIPLAWGALWLLLRDFTPAPKRGTDSATDSPMIAKPTMAILVLVGVCLSAMVLEGGSLDWSAIYMSSSFDTAAVFGGLAVATVALSQAIVRFFADRLIDRFRPVPVARIMQVAMALGVVCVFFAASPLVALAGFALIGGGTATLFPLAISAAAQRSDRPASLNVAALAQFSFVAFLLGPPLLGYVAEHAGLRWVWGATLPLVLLSLALSHKLAPVEPPKHAA
ncbi:MFS transporter [Loktanella sp. SALINAS62]|uniref:MFS transporter n=1 Tax=Loktanella sp. SALINAS62 TaxID=2706124 RepID=UPI001B8D53DB|nr:MFS transporter [Loktanella sp. SALINAS62]MBS1302476.1 MFS transporter [Loktanella sp. SALINAS62]